MIAFSSNFIPRLVYMLTVNPDRTDEGFLEHSLAYFDTRDFQYGIAPRNSTFENVAVSYIINFKIINFQIIFLSFLIFLDM